MIYSMTAFARVAKQFDWGSAVWEIRSVNQRYLEPHFRLPEDFRSAEPALRELARKQLQRGKLECHLKVNFSEGQTGELKVNQDLMQQLLQIQSDLHTQSGSAASLDLVQLMQWPGVLQSEEIDLTTAQQHVVDLFAEAVKALKSMREREGQALATTVLDRLDGIAVEVAKIQKHMPEVLQWQRDKLLNRFAELEVDVEPERVAQEMVMLAQKLDVAEEMDRLNTHVEEVRRIINKGGSVGRRLDFLMQELNREANTTGAKSINSEITASVVELKVLIEQMREQVQNIE